MGMSFAYGGADEATSLRVLHRAVELGVTLIDTAEVYGPYANEELVGRALKELRGKVKVSVATKFGFKILPHGQGVERMAGVDSRPEHIVQAVEGSLSRLGIDCIDLRYQHRVDPAVPIEDVVGAMANLVRAGKVRHLGLSEVSAATLRRAHAVHPIATVQSEYSLWSRDVEAEVLRACRALGIGFVPYSPLGREFLTGQLTSSAALAHDDYRHSLPRFQPQAMAANATMVAELRRLAAARSLAHLEENVAAAQIKLSDAELAAIGAAIAPASVQGARYPAVELAMLGL